MMAARASFLLSRTLLSFAVPGTGLFPDISLIILEVKMVGFNSGVQLSAQERSSFIGKTYGWMSLALFVSAFVSFFAANAVFGADGRLSRFGMVLFGNGMIGFWVLAIAEFVVVMWLSSMIRKISFGTAAIGFFVYAVLNGITLSTIFIVYRISSIASAFFGSAAMFAIMSWYGATTKKNLSSFGKYLIMALIGIIIANAVQFVIHLVTGNPMTFLNFLISVASVAVFTGLTAYDTQKLFRIAESANGSDDYQKISILAALELYLDFINLFLAVLRIFGKRR